MKEKMAFSPHNYESIRELIKKEPKKLVFSFMNANDVYEFATNKNFSDAVSDKKIRRIISIDGITTSLFLSIKNLRILKRLQGPTFTDRFLKDKEVIKNKKHFFWGIGKNGLNILCKKYPLLERKNVYGFQHPFIVGYHFSNKIIKRVVSVVNKNKVDYLWIGAGCPRQEILTQEMYGKINTKCIFNVGAALEYVQGKRKRAPDILQRLGLEWFYRLFSDFELTARRLQRIFFGSFFIFKSAELSHNEGSTDLKRRRKVLFIARFPPPVYGTTLMNHKYRNSKLLNRHFEISSVRMNSAKEISSKEKIKLGKISEGFLNAQKIFFHLLKSPDLVYLDITPRGAAFYRDSLYLLLVKLFRKNILVGFHSKGLKKETENKFKEFYYKFVFKRTRAILLSELLYEDVSNLFQKKEVYFNSNGIEDFLGKDGFGKIIGAKRKKKRILFLSNMLESKGPMDVLKICKLLKDDKINFECLFVGDWENEKFKRKWFKYRKEKGLNDFCKFLGPKYGKEKFELLKEIDFVLFPTRYPLECYPLIILEAFMFGVPVYSYDNGAIREMISQRFLGDYTKMGDYFGLYKKIKENINKPQQREKIRWYFEKNFTFDKAEKRLKKILESALALK